MAAMSRMLPLVAYSTFAIFLLALLATPSNALSNAGGHPHHNRGHDSIAKRKRSPVKRAKRCRPQTSTFPAAAATSATTTSYAAAATTEAADPQSTPEPTTTKAPTSTKAATSAAEPTSTSVSTGGGGGGSVGSKKLLLAWPNGPNNLAKFTGNNVAGMYTWSPYCPDNAKSLGINCYPMLWGSKQKSVFAPNVKTGNGDLMFGFNEPNQGDQANMSPADGAALWNSMIRPYADKGWKLVSPATTSAPSGKTWIQDMNKACGGDCGFDYIALHWYGTSIDEFKAYVDDWYTTFGKPLIISEYACQNFGGGAQCSKSQTETFHYTMGTYFKQHPGVAMFAPFGFMADMYNVNYDNQLMGSDGGPNDLGKWYLYN